MNKKKILGYAVGPIGSSLIGFITLPIITWLYSAEDIGRISILQVTSNLAILFFCLGLDQAYVRAYHETKNKSQLFKLTFLPGFILLIIFSLLITIVNPGIVSKLLYGINSISLSFISLFCFILAFSTRFLSLILRMQERSLAYSMSQLLSKILFLIFILGLILLDTVKNTYTLIAAYTISICAVYLIFSWNTRKVWFASLFCKIDYTLLQQLVNFGLPLIIAGLASWGLNVMDRLFLRSMSTYTELGIYSITMSIAGAATILSSIFNIIWSPMVFKWINEENKENINKIDEISNHLLAVIFFIISLSFCFSWVLPFLLPEEYALIQFLITVCLIGPLLYTLSETTAIGITITRRTSFSMYASIGAMLVNMTGNYLLVADMGASGAAISTAIAFLIFYILRTEFSCLVWQKKPRIKTYLILIFIISSSIINLIIKNTYITIITGIILLIIGGFIFNKNISLAKNFIVNKNKKII